MREDIRTRATFDALLMVAMGEERSRPFNSRRACEGTASWYEDGTELVKALMSSDLWVKQ